MAASRSSSSSSAKKRRSSATPSSNKKRSSSTTKRTASESSRKTRQLLLEEKEQQQQTSSQLLLTWEQVPFFLQFNRYVRNGYRPYLTTKEAWKTMFNSIHNESANIWTHFLPMFIFIYHLYEEIARCYIYPSSENGQEPHPPFRVFYALSAIGCIFVCIVSTTYHTLMCSCKTQGQYQRLICVDILGSVVVISTTALSMLIFGNPCFATFTKVWMTSLFGASTIATIYVIFSGGMSAGQRFLLFGGHLLLRLALQFGILMPKYRNTGHFAAMQLHTHSFVMLLLAGVFNVSRLPERLFTKVQTNPDGTAGALIGRSPRIIADILDYVGNSHNIWHVLSIYSCYLTFQGVAADYAEFHDLDGKVQCGDWK